MPNHLAGETSPYLQQHADNPVDWHPWCEHALTLARETDRPILLSIGYSSCHWCHVMAHESFEDPAVARVMNEHFVNIKVDREERPDLDQIYQAAHYMIARRSGGWPLTMFLTPDQVPFFGGTYFPKNARYQLPGFLDLLPQVAHFYHSHKAEIAEQNRGMVAAFEGSLPTPQAGLALTDEPLERAAQDLADSFDRIWGGFGPAPKFPRPTDQEFCLRYAARGGKASLGDMALFTLEKMERGGIYDQLGGGFCRYSVDERWAIPHFEKMLYDNGPLLGLFTDAFVLTGKRRFEQVCEDTVAWLGREMRSPEGAFYSALDADSEHEEGKFYVWTPDDVKRVLTLTEYAVLAPHYGLDQAANFEGSHWHFVVSKPLSEVATSLNLTEEQAEQVLTQARGKLFQVREGRVRPGRDDKTLVSWNALMIKGLAHAARVFDRKDWLLMAQQAVDFIRDTLWQRGRLLASYKGGQAKLNAYLDDYAFLLDGLLELIQADYRPEDLAFAQTLADTLLEQFEDRENGGFFFTSHDHERLIHRPKPVHDQATPSGNGIATFALQRLGHLLGEARYLTAAERALRIFYPQMSRQPVGFTSMLAALDEYLAPPNILILRGPEPEVAEWRRSLASEHLPRTVVIAPAQDAAGLPATMAKPASPHVNGWLCQGVKCLSAQDDLSEIVRLCKAGEVV
jgi:uncharacterized protein YyaL (SSP411 family)